MDTRGEPQSERLRQSCGAQILQINGKSPAPYNADPTLIWLHEHLPGVVSDAACSLTTTGYVNFRLTGAMVTNVSDASILFAFDLARGNWSQDLIDAFGLPARLYPRVAPCQQVIGRLTPAAAADLGLPPGIPVIAGGEDTSSAGLALGAVRPGMAFLSLGTAGTIYATEARPLIHPQLLTFLHVLDGQSLVGGSMAAIGAALAWLRNALGAQEGYAALTALAEQSPPGASNLIFLPYLSGELQPLNDGYARGVFFGLNMSTGKADLVRAVLEGAAYAIAHNLELAEEISVEGIEIERGSGGSARINTDDEKSADIRPIRVIRVPSEPAIHAILATGGPTRSALWCQIIADVCNRPLRVLAESGGAPLGNALLAGAGIGLIDDLAAVAEDTVQVQQRFEPDAGRHEHYRRLFAIYKQLYPNLKELYAELARV
jgi:xylulokinase